MLLDQKPTFRSAGTTSEGFNRVKKLFYRPHALRLLFSLALLIPFLNGCRGGDSVKTGGGEAQSDSQQATEAKVEAKIFVDDAMLKKPHAIIGGTVENVGGEKLKGLTVEIELRARKDGTIDKREVPVIPSDLAPGEKGRYSLKVLSDEWGSSKVTTLRSASRAEGIAFKPLLGAQRPPERAQGSPNWSRENGDARPRAKPRGEEFINTPDNPVSVP